MYYEYENDLVEGFSSVIIVMIIVSLIVQVIMGLISKKSTKTKDIMADLHGDFFWGL